MVDNPNHIRVLIVEDHRLSAYIAERFLSELGCEVESVRDGVEALDRCAVSLTPHDLVLMDISLSSTYDGCAVAKEINEIPLFSKVPIVALTVHENKRQECLSAGMKEVLVKPLLRAKAKKLLIQFVPKWSVEKFDQKLLDKQMTPTWDLKGEAIDFRYALEIHDGDIDFLKSALQMVVDSLDSEVKDLKSKCASKQWGEARVIIHKLQGGNRYFGLTRLSQICEHFSRILKQNPEDHWPEIYSVMVSEIKEIKGAYQNWLVSQEH